MRLISAGSLVRAQSGPLNRSYSGRLVANEHAANQQTHACTNDVDHDVMRSRGSTREERLMEFVRRRIDHRHAQREHCRFPKTFSHSGPAITHGAQEQRRQNRVFSHMAALAHEKLNQSDRFQRNVRIKPEQEGHDETRSMFGRHQIGRTEKDQTHPGYDEHPVSDDPRNPHVQRESQFICPTAGNKPLSDQIRLRNREERPPLSRSR
jgi:hypothetical protein